MIEDIRSLEDSIMEEIHGGLKYFAASREWSDTPKVADLYIQMAKEEFHHAENLISIMASLEVQSPEEKAIISFLHDLNASELKRAYSKIS